MLRVCGKVKTLAERFFAELTRKRIRRGAFVSVAELEAAIHDYLVHHNAVWTNRPRSS
jgi:hypothetical protein